MEHQPMAEEGAGSGAAAAPRLGRILSQNNRAPLETTAAVGVMPTREKKLQFVSKEEEEESTRLRSMIENLLHLSPYAMCITDMQKEDEPIVYANECFCTWTEYPEDFIVGRNCRFLQGPATDRSVVVAMREAINAGKEFRGMVTNYSRTGTLLYNNLVMTPVKNRDGTVTHFTGIQNFSLEPPNIANTPKAPVEVAFNPLAQHIQHWQETQSKGGDAMSGALMTDDLLEEMAAEAAHVSATMKIAPKSPKSPKDRDSPARSPDRKGSFGKPKLSVDSPYASPLVGSPGRSTGHSHPTPKRQIAPAELADAAVPSKYLKPVNLTENTEPFAVGSSSAKPGRGPRRSMVRRQARECVVTPDGDVWMELLLRSLSPNSVPMLPNQPAAVPSKSRAMTYDDFESAKKERMNDEIGALPAAVAVL